MRGLFLTSYWQGDDSAIALAFGNWTMCRNKDGVPYPATPMQLMHGAIIQAGTITAGYGQIANLTVGTAQIIDLAVETIKVKDEAITISESAYVGGSILLLSTYETMVQLTLESTGSPIHLILGVLYDCSGDVEGAVHTRLLRGEVVIYESPNMQIGFSDHNGAFGIRDVDAGVGFVTYYLQGKVSGGAGAYAHGRSMLILEVKK